MKKNKKEYLKCSCDVSEILEKDNLQQIIDKLQDFANQDNLSASEITLMYFQYDSGCDEFDVYYERLETDEEYQERIDNETKQKEYYEKMRLEQYLKLKDEFAQLGLLDESGNLINRES